MKYRRTFIILIALLFVGTTIWQISQARKATTFSPIAVSGIYSLNLPDYLQKGHSTINKGELKIINHHREIYLIIQGEEKTDSSLNHLDYFATELKKHTDNMTHVETLDKGHTTNTDGKDVIYTYLEGKKLHEHLYTKIAIIEGDKHYFKIIAWTPAIARKRFEMDIDSLIRSFEEL